MASGKSLPSAFRRFDGSSSAGIPRGLHQTSDFAFDVENVTRHTIVLEPASFPRRVPRGLHLNHEVVSTGRLAFYIAPGWVPPNAKGQRGFFVTHPIGGYRLRPKRNIQVIFGLSASRPGIFSFGPVTMHAQGFAPYTYSNYAIICVRVPTIACHKAEAALPGSYRAQGPLH
jgi:hypothetical protein